MSRSKQLFEFQDYRKALLWLIENHPGGSRGVRKNLSLAMRCQLPYLTNVLKGNNDLSLEQSESLGEFFNFDAQEMKYFLHLVLWARAGTKSLKEYYHQEIKALQKSNSEIKNRVSSQESVSEVVRAKYYSSWQYAAIHMIVGIAEFQTVDAISRRLNLEEKQVQKVLGFLVKNDLVLKNGFQYSPALQSIHLERDSDLVISHHKNWRIKSAEAVEREKVDELHYSLALTCAKSDLPYLREVLLRSIEDCAKRIKDSKEEELYSICLDLFRV